MVAVPRNMPFTPGRPQEHPEGYAQSIKRIYLIEETFVEWWRIMEKAGLANDDAVVKGLLTCRKTLMTRSAQEQGLSTNHNRKISVNIIENLLV